MNVEDKDVEIKKDIPGEDIPRLLHAQIGELDVGMGNDRHAVEGDGEDL